MNDDVYADRDRELTRCRLIHMPRSERGACRY